MPKVKADGSILNSFWQKAVDVPQAVAVAYQHPLAAELHHHRVVVHDGPHLLRQVVEHPHVVVADEEMDLHPLVGQLGQLAQQPHMPAGHEVAVGEPEVEDVAQQHQLLAVGLNLVQQTAEQQLALPGVRAAAQMRVRYENYLSHNLGFCEAVPFHSWKENSATPSLFVYTVPRF